MRAAGDSPLTAEQIEDIKSQLQELEPFVGLKVEEIGKFSEAVFVKNHICNSNLIEGVSKPHPRSGYDMTIKT